MNDMSAVIVPKSDQINADSLLSGPITITITSVEIRPGTEQPVSIHFTGDNDKPYKPCKSMARVMVTCWGPDASLYVGRSMTLFCDPKILWGGMAVGGIRISHMSHIDSTRTMALTATKGNKKPFTVQPLVLSQPIPDTLLRDAREAAAKGTPAYTEFWRMRTNPERASLKAEHAALKATAADVVVPQTEDDDVIGTDAPPETTGTMET